MSSNRFYGPLSKLYEGPLNDIRQKVVEEGWFGQPDGRKVTEDFKWPVPESTVKTGPDIHGSGPSPSLTEAHFTEVYGEPLTPIEAPQIEAPTIEAPKIEPPRIEGPRIDP